LTDEGDGVIHFIDDCVQRCLKTPHRYLEERDALVQFAFQAVPNDENVSFSDHQEVFSSPLLITVLEQLGAKLANDLLTSSDVLTIISFIRKLVFNISTKHQSIAFLTAFLDKVDLVVHSGLFPQHPDITTAIRGEITILRSCLFHMQGPPVLPPSRTSTIVQEFLDRIDQVPIRGCLFIMAYYLLSDCFHTSDIRSCMCYFRVRIVGLGTTDRSSVTFHRT
jgi:nucleolar pre-ribosomal-associated protein 1